MQDVVAQGEFDVQMMRTWYHTRADLTSDDWPGVQKWLDQTPGGGYLWSMIAGIYFEREEDMTLFQLTWC
jgi:hypothetical protein